MKLKTSTKISLKFTLFSAIIVVVFAVVLSLFFFQGWYSDTKRKLNHFSQNNNMQRHMIKMNNNMPFRRNIYKFEKGTKEYEKTLNSEIFMNISKLGDQYIIFKKNPNSIVASLVTPRVYSQFQILIISLFLILGISLVAYILSIYFVRSSLKYLNTVVDFTKNLDMDNLDKRVFVPGPNDDEIKVVSRGLNDSLDKISKQTQALKLFVSNASHEIKTPLSEMNTEIDYMKKTGDTGKSIDNLKLQIKNLNNLLERLLLLTKVENGYFTQNEDFNLTDLIEDTISSVAEKYSKKNIHVEENLESDIIIKGNKYSFETILSNLLDNAYKYTHPGGEIKIYADSQKIVIEDNGYGISQENLEKIWDKFWQADQSRGESEGFGLGLSIVKKLVDINGLSISVESQEKIGTKFTIKFKG